MLSIRDPIHGFIRADRLESALIDTASVQRLRFIRQLGLTYMVYPGAEHSRFSHALGAMELAGRVYDALAAKGDGLLPVGESCLERRLVRVAALLHDIGHAPFSHSAEELFARGIDHEQMTRRLLTHEGTHEGTHEVGQVLRELGDGVTPERVASVLAGGGPGVERLLSQVISGELDVDKMDYLLRDSLYCGVRYGSYDLERLLDTMLPVEDPAGGSWVIGVDEGGVHALEALVLARYYMFTQVYFNVTGKALELHLSRWLDEDGWRWPEEPEAFLGLDDVAVTARMRTSENPHARAVTGRRHYPLAYQTGEHLTSDESEEFAALLPRLRERFGADSVLDSHSAKDSHRFGQGTLLVRTGSGATVSMEEASHFIRHLQRIDRYRIYAREGMRDQVEATLREWWR